GSELAQHLVRCGSEKVLFADANENIRDIFEYVLRENGYEPLIASDGMEALRLGLEMRPAAVFLDLWLPEVCGLVVCRRLRAALRQDVLIVVMSADDDPVIKRGAIDGGADAFLVKPFDEERALALIEKAVAERASRVPRQSEHRRTPARRRQRTGLNEYQQFCRFTLARRPHGIAFAGNGAAQQQSKELARSLLRRERPTWGTRDD
ncbi:MAG: response regulator, partial [Deltaproteobacteria bacterium]